MSYSYQEEKPKLLTDDGQRIFTKARDRILYLLKVSGAIKQYPAILGCGVSHSFMESAILDRMVEIGDIREIKRDCFGQDRIFIKE